MEEGEEDERWLLFSGEDGDPAKPCVGGSGGFGLGQPYWGYNCGTHPALEGQSGISPLPPDASHLPATECCGIKGGLCEVAKWCDVGTGEWEERPTGDKDDTP